MLRDPAFFWRPNNIASIGREGGKNRLATKFRKNAPQVCNFLNSFVQDCSFTEFGEELGDQQRPTLERNDMKLGPLN